MDATTPTYGAMQRFAAGLAEVGTGYKVLAAAVLAVLLHRFFLAKPTKGNQHEFPTWGPLEIALVSYVVPARGIGRRL
jgi:hypothetical protein